MGRTFTPAAWTLLKGSPAKIRVMAKIPAIILLKIVFMV
jgi:hypothetical protein